MNITLANFLKFFQDLPFVQIGAAAGAGGLNIPLDIAAAEAILSAARQDFFSGASATTTAATATAAAIAAHVAANS